MKTLELLKSLFRKQGISDLETISSPEPLKAYAFQSVPIYTFYRLGPEFMTWCYPVDTTVIKEQILSPDGIIGPTNYMQSPTFWQNMETYDNEALIREGGELLNKLKLDLELLAEKYCIPGAYTILGSLSEEYSKHLNYFRKAAEGGSKEGMVTYGIMLCMNHQVEDGRTWIEKGADLGDEIGLMCMALSYQYGTFTPVDLTRSAMLYRQLKYQYKNVYAYLNLGVMYVDANYLHTALSLFSEARHLALSGDEHLDDDTYKHLSSNYQACLDLLRLPLSERRKHVVLQYNAPSLDFIFCQNYQSPPIASDDSINDMPDAWLPDDGPEIDLDDIREHRDEPACIVNVNSVQWQNDDFIFPSIAVNIRNEKIAGTQREFIFLEKHAHHELNQYIQKHIGQLRAAFRQKGYSFVYLPAHSYSLNDTNDIITSYANDYGWEKSLLMELQQHEVRSESAYWNTLFAEDPLPDDCAGFLHYRPDPNAPDNHSLYDYIIFPHRPGTNWQKAFATFLDSVVTMPPCNVHQKEKLPQNIHVIIDEQYRILLADDSGTTFKEIKMPVLSKALYFVFLCHPEGFPLKNLIDYRDELLASYRRLSNRKDIEKSIDDLVDPTKNSANEKISRICHAFDEALNKYDSPPDIFVPTGKKGEKYTIALDRKRVIWRLNITNCL